MTKKKGTYPKEADLLESWKEISEYLNRDIKTCQRWEKKSGLPIHRIEGYSKSRVFAYRQELDKWFQEKFTNSINHSHQKVKKFSKIGFILALACMTIAAAAIYLIISCENPKEIDDFRIEGSKLIFLNSKNNKIAEFDTKVDGLKFSGHYKQYADIRSFEHEANFLPLFIKKDLNNDGKKEFLFAVYTDERTDADKIYCFSYEGKKMWGFKAGKVQKYGEKIYADDYHVLGIGADDLNQDGKLEIIVLAAHLSEFPSQMALLDCDGNVMGEYWNSGHFTDYCFFDTDNDKIKEIILTGQNEEFMEPCCIILDFNHIKGFSPQNKSQYQCSEYTFSREKYYLLLPIEAARKLVKDKIAPIRIDYSTENTDEFLTFKNLIAYYFDSNMQLKNIKLIRRAYLDHRKYRRAGTITKEPDQIISELMEEGVLYYDGKGWVREPTMTEFWMTGKTALGN